MADWFSQMMGIGAGDPSNQYRNALNSAAQQQGGFGQSLQGQYLANQAGIANTQGMLQGLANGSNSVSMEQARQNLQQGLAQQQAAAASASPQNAAMAARNAMQNMGQQAYGISGQQALAGLQERQGALNALAQMQMQQSGQNLQGAQGFGQMSNAAYGTDLANPQKTWGQMIGGALGGAAGAAAGFGWKPFGGGGGGGMDGSGSPGAVGTPGGGLPIPSGYGVGVGAGGYG